jgi:hypothetical protein
MLGRDGRKHKQSIEERKERQEHSIISGNVIVKKSGGDRLYATAAANGSIVHRLYDTWVNMEQPWIDTEKGKSKD